MSLHQPYVAAWLAAMLAAGPAAAAHPIEEWPSYNRDLNSRRHSPLTEITPANAGRLRPLCTYEVNQITSFQSGIIVVDGALFGTTQQDTFSIDPDTCKENWRQHEDIAANEFNNNRGPAYLDGKLYRGTTDGRVLAYDAKIGARLWATTIADYVKGEVVTAAPVAWNGLVFIGNAGGDSKGTKGHMFALDAQDGHIVWETFMVPRSPGDFARGPVAPDPNAELLAASWRMADGFPISGGGNWTSYTIDTEHGLVYVPGGNPGPDFVNSVRGGDNLYASSVVVLDAKNGAYRRHFQLVPNDYHDWDVSSAAMLIKSRGGRSLMLDTPKDGHLYGIDLDTGKTLYKQPVTTVLNPYEPLDPLFGTRYCPGAHGGSEWNGPSFDAKLNYAFTGEVDQCYRAIPTPPALLKLEALGAPWINALNGPLLYFGDPDPTWAGQLSAIDVDTGAIAWKFVAPGPILSGVTSTDGGVLLFADANGNVYAFDSANGRRLWTRKLEGAVGGGVITYDTGAGQRVAVAAGMTSPLWNKVPASKAKIVVYGL